MRPRVRIAVNIGITYIAVLGVMTPHEGWAFDFHAFADVSYRIDQHNDGEPVENNGAVKIGPLDLFVAQSIGSQMDALAEFSIESGGIDLERLQISQSFSDALKVTVGRFHTPLGYWNTAYHHGAFLFTTIERPFFLRFEDDGGILPVHTVGVEATGRFFLPWAQLSYAALAGNGPSIVDDQGTNVLDPNIESDPNKNKAVGFHGEVKPAGLPGWLLGASYYQSRVVSTIPTLPLDVTQTILGVNVNKTDGPLELLAEYYLLRHKDHLGAQQDTTMDHLYYVQVSREFKQLVAPYVRHEQASIEEGDPYAAALSTVDTRIETAGVHLWVGEQSALKLEARFVAMDGIEHHNEYAIQWAFTF